MCPRDMLGNRSTEIEGAGESVMSEYSSWACGGDKEEPRMAESPGWGMEERLVELIVAAAREAAERWWERRRERDR